MWSRLATSPSIVSALSALIAQADPAALFVCPPSALEYGFSTRSPAEHTALTTQLENFRDCPLAPTTAEVLAIQGALWHGRLLRAARPMDVLIAAYAMKNRAAVVHYDRDFEYIAEVTPVFQHRWIVPAGSL